LATLLVLVALHLLGTDFAETCEVVVQVLIGPGLREVLDLEVAGVCVIFEGLLVLLLHRDNISFVGLVILELDGSVHALLVLEAHEALGPVGSPHGLRDLAGEDVAGGAEVCGEVLALRGLGEVLDEHVELVHHLGVLDLPHQPELLSVQGLLVLVEQCTFSLDHIVEVDVAEAE